MVQVGDIVDRGGRPDTIGDECSEIKIMDFLDDIHSQAKLYGGGVFCILGNHEIMNVVGNFTYAGNESVKCFGGDKGRKKAFSHCFRNLQKSVLSLRNYNADTDMKFYWKNYAIKGKPSKMNKSSQNKK